MPELKPHIGHWLGRAWLCPNCGKVLRKPPQKLEANYYHSQFCSSPMQPVEIDYPSGRP